MTVTVKTFRIKGHFKGKRGKQPFQYELRGVKSEDIIEQVYSVVGSQHRIPRRKIQIEEIKEI
ncbi:MAG: 50S ribosomal protein L18Ae [Candidatus Helarchaeales archaeon]